MGDKLQSLAVALIGVAVIALIVGNYSGATAIIQALTNGLDTLIKTVTLQGGNAPSPRVTIK